MNNNDLYIKEIVKELNEDNLALFLGAGFSVPSGFVSWKELLRQISIEIGLDVDKETDLVSVAQYHCNENSGNRHKLSQVIIDEFSRNASLSENHIIISKLPIKEYWTTNYDKLIERALLNAQRNPDIKHDVKQLSYTKPHRDCIVYKIHGDVEHADHAVLTKDDYEKYFRTHEQYITALSGSLVSKTFLFIGFSFSDPNLDYVLSRIRTNYTTNQRRHYAILKKVNKNNFKSDIDYKYELRKQDLFINDLLRFNIKTIFVDDYSEITVFLKQILFLYKSKTIFISGAANEYGKYSRDESLQFLHELAGKLISKGFSLVSGFGLGVGSSIITGALEEIYTKGRFEDRDKLILRPFPQDVKGKLPKADLWRKYREDMCDYAGVAIFVFGNKIQDNKIVQSSGMMQEFEIAHSKDLFVIPVGTTGYVAHEIFNIIFDNPEKYDYNTDARKRLLSELDNSDLNTSIDVIISLIEEITK